MALPPALLLGLVFLHPSPAAAASEATSAGEPDAETIVRRTEASMRGKTSETRVKLEIIRPDWRREMEMRSWTKGQDYALVVVLSPARDKGSAFLKRGNEVWSWVPAVDRAIKMPPSMMSQSWMGTDMTNEDFVRESSIIEDYGQEKVGVDTLLHRPCWVLELVPREGAPVVWGKIRMAVDKQDFLQLKTEFFDEDGEKVNTLIAREVGTLGGRPLPTVLDMEPADKPGQRTRVHYLEAEFDKPMPDRTFTVRHLSTFR